mmetsp:Transcript_4719/g.10289  ORF Transcript_4719/g.10289 Transcript_4719/m.10289 type:complete len:305 (-) Transcript_4719:401-1315(-)
MINCIIYDTVYVQLGDTQWVEVHAHAAIFDSERFPPSPQGDESRGGGHGEHSFQDASAQERLTIECGRNKSSESPGHFPTPVSSDAILQREKRPLSLRKRPCTTSQVGASALLGDRVDAVEHRHCWTSHEDLVRLFTPIDHQISPGQRDGARALGTSLEHRRHQQRARARAAGQRRPRASLPDFHLEVSLAEDLHKLDVGLGREHLVALDLGANRRQINRIEVVDEDDGVRVAHADARHLVLGPIDDERRANDPLLRIHRERRWDRRPIKDRLAHVDADRIIRHDLRHNRPCKCGDGIARALGR